MSPLDAKTVNVGIPIACTAAESSLTVDVLKIACDPMTSTGRFAEAIRPTDVLTGYMGSSIRNYSVDSSYFKFKTRFSTSYSHPR